MRNRSHFSMPAVFADEKPNVPTREDVPLKASSLWVYDVTYLHFHRYMEIGRCISGKGICYVDDREYPFQTGDVQIVFPYQIHLSKNTEPIPSQWVWLSVDVVELMEQAGFSCGDKVSGWMLTEMALSGIIDREKYPEIVFWTEKLIDDITTTGESIPHYKERLATDAMEMMLALCRASAYLPKIPLKNGSHLLELAPALDMLRCRLNEEQMPSVSEMGRACGMSPANFRRVFRRELGVSPREHSIACRIHKAKKLLACSGMSITEIAGSVGYQDISGFNRCFLSFTGMSPREFRKTMRKEIE